MFTVNEPLTPLQIRCVIVGGIAMLCIIGYLMGKAVEYLKDIRDEMRFDR